MLLGEQLFLSPQFDAALIQLAAIAVLFFALGMISTVDAVVRALFGTVSGLVGWVPVLNRVVEKPLHSIEQKITDLLGEAEQGVDKQIGRYFNAVAKLIEWVGEEIASHAKMILTLSTLGIGGAIADLLWSAIHRIERSLHSTKASVQPAITRITHVLPAGIGQFERAILGQVDALEAEVEHAIAIPIPNIGARTRTFEEDLARLKKWLRTGARAIPAATVGALALAVLAKIGAGWLRCKPWQKIGNAGCHIPTHFLDDLLALVVDFAVLTQICQAIGWLEKGFGVVEGPLTHLVTGVGKALCGGRYTAVPELSVPPLQIPANPGDATLYLPGGSFGVTIVKPPASIG